MSKLNIIFTIIFLFMFNTLSNSQNRSLYFDGEDDFIRIEGNIFNNLSYLTISAWIKPEPGGMIISYHIHGTYWESVELSTTWFLVNYSNSDGSRQILRFESIDDSIWHHIAAVWTGQEMQIYLDGQPYDTTIVATSNPWNSPAMIAIGGRISTAQPLAAAEFTGFIDEVSLWNIPLGKDQIINIMNNSLTSAYYTSPDSGLIAYWNFDEAEGDTIFDLITNNFSGYIYGAIRSDEASPLALEGNLSTKVLPGSWELKQNYPNPFNPITNIEFRIPHLLA